MNRIEDLFEMFETKLTDAVALDEAANGFQKANDKDSWVDVFANADPTPNKGLTGWLITRYLKGTLALADVDAAGDTLRLFLRHRAGVKPSMRDVSRYGTVQNLAIAATRAAAKVSVAGLTEPEVSDHVKPRHLLEAVDILEGPHMVHEPLAYIPTRLWSEQLFLSAIETDVDNARYVPKSIGTASFWMKAIIAKPGALKYVPIEAINRDTIEKAVERDGLLLRFAQREMKDAAILKLAVQQNGMALAYVGKRNRGALAQEAINATGKALRFVPASKMTPELCNAAVRNDPQALQYVPDDLRDLELCIMAVKANPRAMRHVPDRHQGDVGRQRSP